MSLPHQSARRPPSCPEAANPRARGWVVPLGEVLLGVPALHRAIPPGNLEVCVLGEAQPASPLPHTWPTRNQLDRLLEPGVFTATLMPVRPEQAMRGQCGQHGLPSAQAPPALSPASVRRGHFVEHLGADAWVSQDLHTVTSNRSEPRPAEGPLGTASPPACSTVVGRRVPVLAAHQPSLGEESTLTAKLQSIKVYTNIESWEKRIPWELFRKCYPRPVPSQLSRNVSEAGPPALLRPAQGLGHTPCFL